MLREKRKSPVQIDCSCVGVIPSFQKAALGLLLVTFFFCYNHREFVVHSLMRITVAIRLGEGAVGGAELVLALGPVLDLLASP
jgi:hypothetical protein